MEIKCPYGNEDESGCNNNNQGYCILENPTIKPEGNGYPDACLSWCVKKEKENE